MSKFEDLRQKIKGPVFAVCPAFNEDHSFDPDGTAAYVDFLINRGAEILMVTAGTSRFNLLSKEEVLALNEIVVSRSKGKAISIAANQMIGSTAEAITYAQHAESIGADILLLYYPERHYSDDYVVSYFDAVAKSSDVGLMIHANPFRNARAGGMPTVNYSVGLCKRLAAIPNVVGMKEEHANTVHTYKLATQVGDQMSFIVAGGSMRLFLSNVLYGTHGFLTGVGNFIPEVEIDFYEHCQKGEYDKALEIVTQIEEPFFNAAMPMGWHGAMKGALDILGIMKAHERPPLMPANEVERESLQHALNIIKERSDYLK